MAKRSNQRKEHQEIAQNAARQAAQEVVSRITEVETGEEDDSVAQMLNGGSHPHMEPVVESETDVFVVGNRLSEDGMNIRYEIHENGCYVDTVYPPYSWEEVKDTHAKSGIRSQFRILARNDKGHLVKTQTLMMNPSKKSVEPDLEAVAHESNSALDIARLITEAADKNRREMMEMLEKQRADQNANQNRPSELTELLKTVLPVLLAPKKEDSSGLREVVSEFKQMFTQMKADADRKNDRLELELKHLAEKMNQKPNNEMDPWKIISTVRESENRGFELRERLSREAEERAEEKAMAAKGEGGEKSTIDQIIETGAKLLNSGMLKGMGQPTRPRKFLPNPQARRIAKPAAPQSASPKPPQTAPAPTLTTPPTPQTVDDTLPTRDFTEPSQALRPLIEVLEESVTESLTGGEDPKLGAERLVKKLEVLQVPLADALQEIPLSRAIELSKSRGMPELVETWLAQTYGILNSYDVSVTESSGVQPGPGGNE